MGSGHGIACGATTSALVVGAATAMLLLSSCGGNGTDGSRRSAWPRIVVSCDSSARRQLERMYARRGDLQKLSNAWQAEDRALDAGRRIPETPPWLEELGKSTLSTMQDCGKKMSASVSGLDPPTYGDRVLSPDWQTSFKSTKVVMTAFVNYRLRTRRTTTAPASEIRTDMAAVASQLVPALFAAYPVLQYVVLHAHQQGIVATMGVTRHGSAVLGDSIQMYDDACRGIYVPGLGYSDAAEERDFEFELNRHLVREN